METVVCLFDLAMTLTEIIVSLYNKQEFEFVFNLTHFDILSNLDHSGLFQILTIVGQFFWDVSSLDTYYKLRAFEILHILPIEEILTVLKFEQFRNFDHKDHF